MSQRLNVLFDKKPCYDIVYESSFDKLAEELSKLGTENKKLCIITDSKVGALYGKEVQEAVTSVCKSCEIFSFPEGENNKTLDTVKDIYKFLIEHRFDRKDMLLALGGGVTGDITGYTAATYLRGIEYVQIPTTLLAQADSSIGGKTGVDFDGYKNMVGAFERNLFQAE